MPARQVQNNRLVARKTAIAQLVAQLFMGGAMLGAAMPASAASCNWNTTAGNWAALGNWLSCAAGNGNPASTPGAADSATIGASGAVTINTGQSIFTLTNAGTITIDAFGLNLVGSGSTTNTGTINVGGASTANIGVSAGHNINNTGGTINIAAGSVVNQFGSTITGGTIATTGTGALVVFGNNVLSGVTLNGTLDAAANTVTQHIQNGLALNNGTVKIDNGSLVNLEGTQTIGGTGGSFVFGATGNNRLGVDGGGITTTLGANVTVRGHTGTVGVGQLINGSGNTLLNLGTISADSGGTISIAGAALTNQNIVEATGAGSVLRLDTAVTNAGGTLRSTAGGVVLQNGVNVTGGNITNSGGATYRFSNSGSNVLSGVTLTSGSTIDMASAIGLGRVVNGMTINGTVNINNGSLLNFEGNQTLGGTGSIVFGATAGNNRVGVDGGSKTLTIASGMTIQGANGSVGLGQLVNGSGNAIINNGTISANVAGGTIAIAGLDAGITNNGTISALNGGTIALQSNLIGGAGGQLVAGAGSVISQQGVTISGIVNTSGGGSLRPTNSGFNILSGVTLNGNLDMASATATERVINNLVLNGAININNSSLLNFEGTQALSGTGTIIFGASGSNRVGVDGGNKTLTVASTVTIRGENGTIGLGQLVNGSGNAIVNNGTISANVAGGTVAIAGLDAGITNNGTISALNGGTIALQSNLIGGAGGQLVAGAGSVISQQGVTISGIVNTSGGGNLRPTNSGFNILSGVTLNGNLDMASAAATERVMNNLALNGVININSGSLLNFEGDQTLSGTGSIVFGAASSNKVGVDGGNKTLTVASGVTIRGENGTIGLGQLVNGSGNTLINQGLISSDSGGTVSLAGATLVNQNIVEATGAGSVLRLDTTVNNTGGTLRSTAGGVMLQNGVTVTGGNITNSGGATYKLSNSGSNFLSGVTLTGGSTIDMASAASLGRVVNGMTVNGIVNINGGNLLNMEGNQTLAGTGSIVFGATGNNRVGVDGGGKTLTVASGVTISGVNGSIGLGQLVNGSGNAIVNNGTINSDGGGIITIQGLDNGITSNGLLRAQNGTLNVSTLLLGTGTLQVDAAGVMNLANGAKTQGTLAMGATGATLALGTGNLTLNTDYTNVGAGTGNAFNRRAGVTGAGLIVAGGNATQAITGAGVTNGNTANATLTFGNMRVGATTTNYQVANTGTTGPSLRGAIQTNVNGANLTDARLSGAGVTASNYNTGAPGSNTGNLGVTFTASTAGALAPLTGQVLNLRSSFENIADQRLNIVLGAGAAAFNAAVGSATPSPVTVANQRIGGTNVAALTVANTASAGAFSEDLNASFGTSTGAASGTGSISGRLAGTNNTGAGAITASVSTATAGAKTGTVTLNYQTAGAVNGVSNGLGVASVGSQTVTVNGNVYQAATGSIQSAPLNFGTVQVGQSVSQNLVIRNTASGAAGFVEDLNASFGSSSGTGAGLISGTGSLSGILAGTNSTGANGSMLVTVNTAAAGTVNGNIAVNYQTAGAIAGASNGLGTAAAGSEAYGVNGLIQAVANVINQAAPVVNNPTINLGNVRVGAASPTALVSVTNQATTPPQAALNASIGGATAGLTASGSFSLLNPGATNNTSLQVGMNTATSGNKSGAATISFVSDANNVGNCAPNCQLNLATQNVTINGAVYQAATGAIQSAPLNFGTVQVGQSVSQNLVIRNTATGAAGFVEDLNASFGSASGTGAGLISGTGSLSGILAGTNSNAGNGSMFVSVNTAAAGTVNGNIAVNYTTAGAVNSVSNGLGTASAGSEAYGVNGLIQAVANVINQASPLVNNPTINLGAVRVGAASPTANISVTNVSTVAPQAALNASIASNSAPVTAAGSFNLLNPGTTNNASLQVGLNTATAGNFTGGNAGSATISFVSDASNVGNCAPNCQLSIASQIVNLSGKVYTAAVGLLNTAAVNFGIVRVGDVVASQNIGVQNTAAATALNDTLRANLGGVGGAFTGTNTVGGVTAQSSGNITVGLNTGAAGIFNQNGAVSFLSQNADMADVSAGANQPVLVTAQVNNHANGAFSLVSGLGALTLVGTDWVLDLGNVALNSTVSDSVKLTNNTTGPADDLSGVFNLALVDDFVASGFGPVSGLGAGQSSGNLNLNFAALSLGLFQDIIDFDGFGTNASDLTGVAQSRRLIIRANVFNATGNQVPEPGTLALLLVAAGAAVMARRRRTMAK